MPGAISTNDVVEVPVDHARFELDGDGCHLDGEPAAALLGLRWTVERTNSLLCNVGQQRPNTD
ncbi:hypothetical protein [Candidatus Poriferisodalis sp.]|uniref:hypothetical protein n=1 Tax=Candidatus Poriferisodalis sp. TaxID=3101277 RepID=UPI003B51EAD6